MPCHWYCNGWFHQYGLHLLAIAQEAEAGFTMDDIDMLSRKTPCLCKVAPNTHTYHVQDVNRAGGIMGIMNELLKNGLVDGNVKRVDGMTLAEAVDKFAITSPNVTDEAVKKYKSAPAHRFSIRMGSQETYYKELDTDRAAGCIRDIEHAYSKDGGLAVLKGNIALDGCVVKTAGVDESIWKFAGPAKVFDSQDAACEGILGGKVVSGDVVVITHEGPKGGPGMQEMLLSYFLYKKPPFRQGVRADHRRSFQWRYFRSFYRSYFSRSCGRRSDWTGERRRYNRD